MINQRKKRHHLVWKYYLKKWSNNDKIWCKTNGKITNTNIQNVGIISDFYKVKIIPKKKIDYLLALIEFAPLELKPVYSEIVENFITISEDLIDLKEIRNFKSDEAEKKIMDIDYNLEENIYCNIEKMALQFLESIYEENISFLEDSNSKFLFFLFLAHQHFRTEQSNIANDINLKPIWHVLRHIHAAGLAWSLIKYNFKVELLKNKSTEEFITSDQPTVNIKANYKDPPQELDLIYPVTPWLAVRIFDTYTFVLNEKNVIEINRKLAMHSYKQIYSRSEKQLLV